MPSLFHRLSSVLRPSSVPKGDERPSAPEGWCIYAIGDIHGERRCLERIIETIEAHHKRVFAIGGEKPILIFLGDYVDRGPDSKGVLDILCRFAAEAESGAGPACRFVAGNHETAMREFLDDPEAGAGWLEFGGAETLASYGVRVAGGVGLHSGRWRDMADSLAEKLPEAHRVFLEGLEPMVVLGDYVFVHAGVRPGVSLERQRLEDMQCIREPFLSSRRYHGKVVVHGHTPVEHPQVLPNRIGVDTGVYATGVLSAAVLHGRTVDILTTA
ncbi:MAG: metallophosphoesterase [Rhodospirillaceae bacterium]